MLGPRSARSMPLPELSEWQRTHEFEPRALSEAGVTPQAYVSYNVARRACQRAGKRLCSVDEWETACRGAQQSRHPYGEVFQPGRCNIHVGLHPAHVLHGAAYLGHLDPRLNLLIVSNEGPLLRTTGASSACKSPWGGDAILDMVGNLDEWVENERPTFRGGFYARGTTKGCAANVTNHGATYYDYSTGTRCCLSP
jgi:sulfatase modifying factor 1